VLAGVDEAGSAAEEERNGLLVLTPVTRRPRRTHPGCTTIRYRRNNNPPELDRRRVHFCDAPGQSRRALRPPAMTTWRSLSRCKILLKSMR